ncbi:hypothetical protein C8A05DRAFT_47517 [Staphylotrichum tortipilum]|uniref:Uncharacterized protein n=1 Tax=Staphylotrichum tortipilum TaxID=2831512 RepID=A0AAN6RNY4_9PEZI|nr:hypothetical protein C8A05DRAFT_47517 [Staphylotrichum longicolle]
MSMWSRKTGPKISCSNTALYRMYEYLVVSYTIGLRTEIELFYNQPTWSVAGIPDPQDPTPERYAILAVLPFFLTVAFSRLIKRGARPVVLETEPAWAGRVPPVERRLVIPDRFGEESEEETGGARFLEMNIVVGEPHILFV